MNQHAGQDKGERKHTLRSLKVFQGSFQSGSGSGALDQVYCMNTAPQCCAVEHIIGQIHSTLHTYLPISEQTSESAATAAYLKQSLSLGERLDFTTKVAIKATVTVTKSRIKNTPQQALVRVIAISRIAQSRAYKKADFGVCTVGRRFYVPSRGLDTPPRLTIH